jgi:hypothetical protein
VEYGPYAAVGLICSGFLLRFVMWCFSKHEGESAI